jgi:hypothetical protein
MKNIFKSILVAIIVIGGFTSCTESDLAIDNLYDNVDTSGSALRILAYPADIVGLPGGSFPADSIYFRTEVQQGDGSFPPEFKEVRVKLQIFEDQDTEIPLSEQVVYRTITSEEFIELSTANGLPVTDIIINTEDLFDYFTNIGTEFSIPAFILTNFELEMSDGRVWDASNAGGTLSGPYFESPFAYRTIAIFN